MTAQMPTACHMEAHTYAGSTARYSTAQHSTAQPSPAQPSTAHHHAYTLSCLFFAVISNKAEHALNQSSNIMRSLIDVLQQ